MLLPTKGISADRALLTIGADILEALTTPTSVSGLWERFTRARSETLGAERVTFDWFSLALASLFTMGVIELMPNGYIGHVSA
jgi:hypothetical protein